MLPMPITPKRTVSMHMRMRGGAWIVNERCGGAVSIFMKTTVIAIAAMLIVASLTLAAESKPVKVLIITGDHVSHAWKETTPFLKDLLTKAGMQVDVTETP